MCFLNEMKISKCTLQTTNVKIYTFTFIVLVACIISITPFFIYPTLDRTQHYRRQRWENDREIFSAASEKLSKKMIKTCKIIPPWLRQSMDYKKLILNYHFFFKLLEVSILFCTLRSLLDEWFILSEQGSIFLEKQLSEHAELSEQGGIILEQY